MVRDEVDVVAAMVEHHLDQGVDLLVVTDNASVDGTTEVLAAYEATGRIELHHDPVHRKQQGDVVTAMARRARTVHRADWVLNLDADEFMLARDPGLTVRAALEATPLHLNAFTVDVVNMIGPTAESGAGFDRLVWRDHRPDDLLVERELHAHPTPNAVHRGESDVVVQQGNHFTSLVSNGQPDEAVAMEVLHLPWRSWSQFERKVVNAGRGYEASPTLRPSPRHHGMRDYRLWQEGRLHATYDRRCPSPAELDEWAGRGWVEHDTRLLERLTALQERALRPDLLGACLR
ncbi:hypothetical protein GCM10007231_15710 [Nocardioides daphniae]|uniref:Glycosyltransferase family 2 protein n=2 Tax=Nocardioides daphniae TaxID=402297 RepID=A0ABQ1Q7D0_9ACTN|nr:hypothetical protein GCM10007231_15710 [Nocardioides daphniae]